MEQKRSKKAYQMLVCLRPNEVVGVPPSARIQRSEKPSEHVSKHIQTRAYVHFAAHPAGSKGAVESPQSRLETRGSADCITHQKLCLETTHESEL